MTFLPPDPALWEKDGMLQLRPGPDGHYGEIWLGNVPLYVCGWQRGHDGIVRFHYQHASDAEFEAIVAHLRKNTTSG